MSWPESDNMSLGGEEEVPATDIAANSGDGEEAPVVAPSENKGIAALTIALQKLTGKEDEVDSFNSAFVSETAIKEKKVSITLTADVLNELFNIVNTYNANMLTAQFKGNFLRVEEIKPGGSLVLLSGIKQEQSETQQTLEENEEQDSTLFSSANMPSLMGVPSSSSSFIGATGSLKRKLNQVNPHNVGNAIGVDTLLTGNVNNEFANYSIQGLNDSYDNEQDAAYMTIDAIQVQDDVEFRELKEALNTIVNRFPDHYRNVNIDLLVQDLIFATRKDFGFTRFATAFSVYYTVFKNAQKSEKMGAVMSVKNRRYTARRLKNTLNAMDKFFINEAREVYVD